MICEGVKRLSSFANLKDYAPVDQTLKKLLLFPLAIGRYWRLPPKRPFAGETFKSVVAEVKEEMPVARADGRIAVPILG
jgi:hypothetical protein